MSTETEQALLAELRAIRAALERAEQRAGARRAWADRDERLTESSDRTTPAATDGGTSQSAPTAPDLTVLRLRAAQRAKRR